MATPSTDKAPQSESDITQPPSFAEGGLQAWMTVLGAYVYSLILERQ